jgi:hypothetical protein
MLDNLLVEIRESLSHHVKVQANGLLMRRAVTPLVFGSMFCVRVRMVAPRPNSPVPMGRAHRAHMQAICGC